MQIEYSLGDKVQSGWFSVHLVPLGAPVHTQFDTKHSAKLREGFSREDAKAVDL